MLKELIEEFILKYIHYVNDDLIDCSELAEWLINFLDDRGIEAKIARISSNGNFFKVYENGRVEEVIYHEVVLVEGNVIDVRDYGEYNLQTYLARLHSINNSEVFYESGVE